MALNVWSVSGGERFRRHAHEMRHLCMVLAGGFVERDGRGWVDVGAGTLRVSGPASHDIDFGSVGARCLIVVSEEPDVFSLPKARFLARDHYLAALVRRVEDTVVASRPTRSLELDDLQAEVWAQVERRLDGRPPTPPPAWLSRIREALHDLGGRSSVSALASLAGVHRVHLARAFRDHYGTSVSECARRLRVRGACRLLAQDGASLSQVAAEMGFADQSHLTRALRAYVGTTPAAFREAMLHRFKTRGPALH